MDNQDIFDFINSMRDHPLTNYEMFISEIKAYIAGSFLACRKMYNLTQEQLADILGLKKQAVEYIEAGITIKEDEEHDS